MTTKQLIAALERAQARVRRERSWVEQCGATLAGYVARYGDSRAPAHERYGEGGQRIYEADLASLRQAELELHNLQTLQGQLTPGRRS